MYLNPGVHNAKSFDLYTYGADGVSGGTEENKDINNW
ncbi:type II secretion system protein GspG [Bathymodiolus heckerae thiotrophic gill symbiont]|nr:type II secretion system protein GspG [Bathymodiolus heckerae thiotrophic gill symbiont]